MEIFDFDQPEGKCPWTSVSYIVLLLSERNRLLTIAWHHTARVACCHKLLINQMDVKCMFVMLRLDNGGNIFLFIFNKSLVLN